MAFCSSGERLRSNIGLLSLHRIIALLKPVNYCDGEIRADTMGSVIEEMCVTTPHHYEPTSFPLSFEINWNKMLATLAS